MAIQKVDSALLLGASKTKTRKGAEVFRLQHGGGSLNINPSVYEKVLAGEIVEVEYDDEVEPFEFTNDAGAQVSLKFFNISGVRRSNIWKMQEAKKLVEASEGLDVEAFNKAMAAADKIEL